jgi:hypothetical protein
MQSDGNLVLYNEKNKRQWTTGTNSKHVPANLILKNDGNLVIEDKAGDLQWATNKTASCSGLNFLFLQNFYST